MKALTSLLDVEIIWRRAKLSSLQDEIQLLSMMYKTWRDLTSAITRCTFSVLYFLCVYNFAHILLSVNLCWNSRITSMITSPFVSLHCCCCCSVTKLCPTCCNSMDCSTLGFPVLHWLLEFAQIRVHWVGCHFLLQGIFPTQELNPCLLHYRWILYHWAIQEAQVFIEPLHFESESIWHLCSPVCVCVLSHLVMSNSLCLHGL